MSVEVIDRSQYIPRETFICVLTIAVLPALSFAMTLITCTPVVEGVNVQVADVEEARNTVKSEEFSGAFSKV